MPGSPSTGRAGGKDVPRTNSLGDLKIPTKVSQTQSSLRDLGIVREFAGSVERKTIFSSDWMCLEPNYYLDRRAQKPTTDILHVSCQSPSRYWHVKKEAMNVHLWSISLVRFNSASTHTIMYYIVILGRGCGLWSHLVKHIIHAVFICLFLLRAPSLSSYSLVLYLQTFQNILQSYLLLSWFGDQVQLWLSVLPLWFCVIFRMSK